MKIESWTCYNCNLYNDILTEHCKDCYSNRPLNLEQIAAVTRYKRKGYTLTQTEQKMPEKDRIELHTKFYNHEKPLYSAMTFEQRRAHREEIELVLLEGRARVNSMDDVDRDERATKGPKGREWLTSNNGSDSELLNQPKIRKERMSKADKLAEDMAKLGLDKNTINAALGEVARAQSGGSVVTSSNRELKQPAYSFTKENPVNNTSESLLADISTSMSEGIHTRPIEHLVEAAVTAGHLANKVLGKFEEVEEKKEFNPLSLFGK